MPSDSRKMIYSVLNWAVIPVSKVKINHMAIMKPQNKKEKTGRKERKIEGMKKGREETRKKKTYGLYYANV